MYGVVIWSDIKHKRAVIWCEDHGDLAFYTRTDANVLGEETFDPGDLVHFDIVDGQQMRIAVNPRVVAEQQFPMLADRLGVFGGGVAESCGTIPSGNVVPFPMRNARRRLAS